LQFRGPLDLVSTLRVWHLLSIADRRPGRIGRSAGRRTGHTRDGCGPQRTVR
jgi:hypothetical protein